MDFETYAKPKSWRGKRSNNSNLNAALAHFESDAFYNDALNSIKLNTALLAKSPYSHSFAKLIKTLTVKASFWVNILVFQDFSNGKVFAVIQDCQFFKGLCLLEEKQCFAISNIVSGGLKQALMELFSTLQRNILSLADAYIEPKCITAIAVTTHLRPYHQIYDQLPMAFYLSESGVALDYYGLSQKTFIDLSDFTSIQVKDRTPPEDALVLACGRANRDKPWKQSAKRLFKEMNGNATKNNNQSDNVFWFGMCMMKRSWEEFGEFVGLVVQSHRRLGRDVTYAFDGLTCPIGLDESEFQQKHCAAELAEYRALINKYGIAEHSMSLIGVHASKKLEIAARAFYFVSHGLTDSIWTDAIMHAPGVCHFAPSSKRMVNKAHFHVNSVLVPEELVEEQRDTSQRLHWGNYSISPQAVFELLPLCNV